MIKALNFIAILFLVSCKTINVHEKWAFQESKYKLEVYTKHIGESKDAQSKKDSLLLAIDNIITKNDEKILTKGNVELNRYFIKNENLRMEYFIFQPKKSNKVALFFLGNGSSIFNSFDNLYELSEKTNTKIYVLNYRGYGKSDGSPSFKTQFDDDMFFFNKIMESENKIEYVVGFSLGSIFATHLVADKNIRNLFLLSPFSDTKDYFSYLKKQNTKGLKSLARPFLKITAEDYLLNISNVEKVKNYNGKIVIFHGTNDAIFPYKMGNYLYLSSSSTNKKLYTIENGNHDSIFKNENWKNLINEVNNM